MATSKTSLRILLSFSRLFLVVGLLNGCAADPVFQTVDPKLPLGTTDDSSSPPKTDPGANPPKVPNDDSHRDFDRPFNDPQQCADGDEAYELFNLTVDAAEAFNVVFILDDSSSMGPLIDKVVEQTQGFISDLLQATTDGDSVRVVLVFDPNTHGSRQHFSLIDGTRNPFIHAGLVDNERVFSFDQETGSKWADLAFYRVFGQADEIQTLPPLLPLDRPASGASVSINTCNATGVYFRPRVYPFNQDVGWPWVYANNWKYAPCASAVQNQAIEDFLIPGVPVNIVTLSDDDLNVNFDRYGFDPDDPNKKAYPEVADLMFKDLMKPLGSDYYYHSIVNSNLEFQLPQWQEIGIAHWALSRHTGGAVFDIQQPDFSPIFDQLVDEILFLSQARTLFCQPQPASVQVFRGSLLMGPETYEISVSEKRLTFKPEFFEGLASGEKIEVRIEYSAEAK